MRQSLRVLMLGDWVTLWGPPSDKAFTNLRYLRVGDIVAFPFKDPSQLNKLRVFLNKSKPGMNLSHLPPSLQRISHQVVVPDMEYYKFVRLPFENLSSLKSFIVETRRSVELPEELHLPASLLELDLNRCKNFPKDIGHLTALESLILDSSDVECLPQGFGKLKKLKHLSMNDCSQLASLPKELGMLSSLEVLSMNGCQRLRTLPESLGELLSLQTLDLTGCIYLQLLPESFGGFLSLQTLELIELDRLWTLPESFGALRIRSLTLHSLGKLHNLPNSFGNMPLLKDLSLISCDSLMSLPDSFVQLKILETLDLIKCTNLRVLPQDFGRLRCLNHMTVKECHLLKELPHAFGTLPALKTFRLQNCDSIVNLPRDFGKLKKLRLLYVLSCHQLKTLSDDYENMASLEQVMIKNCPELDGAMMEKILKLQNCYMAHIGGSRKLLQKWGQMQGRSEHQIVIDSGIGEGEKERRRAVRVALLHGKCVEVNDINNQLMERSSLLMGLQEGLSTTVALLMLPIHLQIQSHQHEQQRIQRFMEMERERAKGNGLGKLQIVCARSVDLDAEGGTPTEEEERAAEEGIRQIVLSLPKGSYAIPSSESKRIKILTWGCNRIFFAMANVGLDMEGREFFEDYEMVWEENENYFSPPPSDIRLAESKDYYSIWYFINSIRDVSGADGLSQSQCVEGDTKTRVFMEALKSNGIHYLLIPNNKSKMVIDDLHGKTIGFVICHFKDLE